jgi:hypothetical protein
MSLSAATTGRQAVRPRPSPRCSKPRKPRLPTIRSCAALSLCWLLVAHAAAAAENEARPAPSQPSPIIAAGVWAATQLIPSPLVVVGERHVGGGLRWQLTPLLYSFGIAARPFRSLYVSPIARHSGSIELHASPEWSCCAADSRSSWLLRVGPRLYLPLLEHGEVLSWSIGSSYLRSFGKQAGAAPLAFDLGIYSLFGVLGVTMTVSPWLARREVIVALNVRYF